VTGLGYLFVGGSVRARVLRSAFLAASRPVLGRRPRFTIFQNEDDREVFIRLKLTDPDHAVLIRGSGVNPDTFRPPAVQREGLPLVMLPSRMLWDKGVGEFAAAAALLKTRGVLARFALVGEPDPGNPRSVPKSQLEEWHRSGVLEWWGHRSDMPNVLAEASVVALPSTYREGVPKVLIEAASCGRPIVTTEMPGCRDIVRDGVNGVLVAPGDAEALAAALTRLLGDKQGCKQMGRAGRALVQREFSERTVVARTLEVYERTLAAGAAPMPAY
jgi:glycosyltransferase involved in cell wall biosynthesis